MTKVQAITDASEPSQVSELKSFLGLVNYVLCPIQQLPLHPFTSYWVTLSHGSGSKNSNQFSKEQKNC